MLPLSRISPFLLQYPSRGSLALPRSHPLQTSFLIDLPLSCLTQNLDSCFFFSSFHVCFLRYTVLSLFFSHGRLYYSLFPSIPRYLTLFPPTSIRLSSFSSWRDHGPFLLLLYQDLAPDTLILAVPPTVLNPSFSSSLLGIDPPPHPPLLGAPLLYPSPFI